MKNFKYNLILSLAIILCLQIFGFSQTEIKTTVEKFYKFHRTRSGLVSTHELNLLKGWLTNDLTNLFRTEIRREDEFIRKNPNDKPYFGDGFPFQPFNECVIDNKIFSNLLEIGEVKTDVSKAIVEVKFVIPKECENQVEEKLLDTYKIELLKTKSRWLINDWIYSDKSRLSEILKRKEY